jgi:multiple sugar transport system ATP-binding protein
MPHISFQEVTKNFGKSTVIHGFSAEIDDGEFLVLLGPSGCGKSTMLRVIAGLADMSSGAIEFDGKIINGLEPKERKIAFVFQSYALYPHMSVYDNIAFPLIMDRFKPWYHVPIINSIARRILRNTAEVKSKVEEVAHMLELEPMLTRRPRTLSGGQRQRVAVARALVRDPDLYLLDEPLSNLDAKLRTQMRSEITDLYKKVKKSFIYVTHDQVEAMTMATKMIVMNDGEIRQIGSPEEVYHSPADTFVAKFIGSPPMNIVAVTASGTAAELPNGEKISLGSEAPKTGAVLMGVRPEHVRVVAAKKGVSAVVESVENLGAESILALKFVSQNGDSEEVGSKILAKVGGSSVVRAGDTVGVEFEPSAFRWFDVDSQLAVD